MEALSLKVIVDVGALLGTIATCVAAVAAWQSAKLSKDAVKEMQESSFDSFLPVLQVEQTASTSPIIELRFHNIGRGPLHKLLLIEPRLQNFQPYPMIEQNGARLFKCNRGEIKDSDHALFEFEDLFGRKFQTKITWFVHTHGIDIKESCQSRRH